MLIVDEAAVHARIGMGDCIPIVQDAMIALSSGEVHDLPRQIIPGGQGMFGVMAGSMAKIIGAKLMSVFPHGGAGSTPSHQGLIALFDPVTGSPLAVVHAGAVTALRTAAASAVATDVLARPNARTLAVLGTGEQARAHIQAIGLVRNLDQISIWGRDAARAWKLASEVEWATGARCVASDDLRSVTKGADIICTVTSSADPVLGIEDVDPGTHINAVGSSRLGPSEIDEALVARCRFYGDSRASVLAQGAEFARARSAGLIDDSHFLAELGEVMTGAAGGRRSAEEITLYKSLGHIVQDLATAAEIVRRTPSA